MSSIQTYSLLARNIKFLRNRRKLTQVVASELLGITRSQLASYETNISPGMEVLVRISDVFHISLDILLREELSKMPESKLREITFSAEDYPSGKFLRVLTTMVDSNERELIEMVSEKAKAGYTSGYADPEFIGELPRFQLPMLPGNRKYRGFQLSGDSMLPMASGSWVIAEYVDDWQRLKDGSRCVVLTRNDGIVFKIVYRHSDMTYLLVSQNPSYQPYELNVQEIVEIWRFKMVLTDRFE